MSLLRAYLDIETTGCRKSIDELTVIGIAVERDDRMEVVQLVGGQITEPALRKALAGVCRIYTYNGSRFDFPFLRHRLKVDLTQGFKHTDLMYACWKNKLKGGLKSVEMQLGIGRQTVGVDGWMAVKLWWDYVNNQDMAALERLLEYNKEDVVNLQTLRLRLGVE